DFFKNHYEKKKAMPEPLIIEALAQVGGWAISVSRNHDFIAIMVMVRNAEFFEFVYPGDQLVLHVEIMGLNEYGGVIKGEAFVKGKLVARFERLTYVLYKVPLENKEFVKNFQLNQSGGIPANK
ncbi:MAG: hypothetical protein SV062_11790, partial [Thermodesulfobacteriota bacterium]|nr:hypothetical protein [Thermodesulfobacteriota bacterium]